MDRATLVLAIGAVMLVGAAVGGPLVSDSDYVHRLYSTNTTFNASEPGHYRYANLSSRGQNVVDRTIERDQYAVDDESETVPEFEYPTDEIQFGTGRYVIQRDGRAYEITTIRDRSRLLGGLLTLFVFPALALLRIAFCVSGVLLRLRNAGGD
jgi:hypothetical protein